MLHVYNDTSISPKVKIKIGGYTDNVGNAASNMKLSAERAAVVMDALVAGGIDKSRLESEGYGDKNAVASNDTDEGKAKNRQADAHCCLRRAQRLDRWRPAAQRAAGA